MFNTVRLKSGSNLTELLFPCSFLLSSYCFCYSRKGNGMEKEKSFIFKYTEFCTFWHFFFNLWLNVVKLVTAPELDGSKQKSPGNSKFRFFSVWQVIFLAKIPAPLKFEVCLELLFSKHKLSPGWKWVLLEERARWQSACPAWGPLSAWLRLDRSWERGEEAACECQAPSASPLLPAFPSSKASWGFLDRKQACPVYTVFAVACPGTGSSKSRCPRVADVPCHVLLEQIGQCWKIWGQAPPRVNPPSDVRLCQTRCWEGVVVCWSVDLCFEGSAWFLFETWERRKEGRRLFAFFFYGWCFQ